MSDLPAPTAADLVATAEGHLLAVRRFGQGPPLLAAPGGPGGFGRLWDQVLAPLANRFRIVLWDYRGCGDSPLPEQTSMAGDLRDLTQLAESLAPERPILLGHSYGGMLVQALATTRPDLCRALVLVQTVRHYGALVAGHLRLRERRDEGEHLDRMSLLGRLVREEVGVADRRAFLRASLAEMLRNQAVLEEILRHQDVSFPVRLRVQEDLAAFDVRPHLAALELPVLVTDAPGDLLCGREPEEIHRSIPGSHRVEFLGSGHYPQMEERERFLEALSTWLEAQVA